MIIAINTRSLSGNNETGNLLIRSFTKLAEINPGHTFIFISNQPLLLNIPAQKNVETIVLPQQSQNPLLWKLWYNYKLPAVLKKNKVDVLIHADIICSLRTKIRQLVTVCDLSFLQQPAWLNKKYGRFVLSNALLYLSKAKKIFTLSGDLKSKIDGKYKTTDEKIVQLYPFAEKGFASLDWKEKETIKEQYAEGKEYFLFYGSLNESSNLINLLKAFSLFKKRQKSNMQLLIAYPASEDDAKFKESLRLYKFRQEVKLIHRLEEKEIKKVFAAAYAFVYPVLNENFQPVLNAMQCEIPVITGTSDFASEIFGDSVLYANPNSFEDIAQQMMLLFKDENSRNELISKAKRQAGNFSIDKTAPILWQAIMETTH